MDDRQLVNLLSEGWKFLAQGKCLLRSTNPVKYPLQISCHDQSLRCSPPYYYNMQAKS